MCFIMEKLDGGELLDQIYYLRQKGRALSERIIANYFIQLINALSYLHEKGIIHRDIKPANLMLVKKSKKYDSPLKLVDFGLAIQLKFKNKEFQKTNEFCGTATFMAPEIYIGKKYGFEVDMWASGIVLYMLLFGCKPFNYNKNRDIKVLGHDIALKQDNTITDILNKHTKDDRKISKDAKDLLIGLLERNPKKRFNAKKVLFHDWFKNASDKQLISTIQQERLKMEVIQKQFKSGVFAMMALIRIIKTITDTASIDDIISIRSNDSDSDDDNQHRNTRSQKNNSVVINKATKNKIHKNYKNNNNNNGKHTTNKYINNSNNNDKKKKNGNHNINNDNNNNNNNNNQPIQNQIKDISIREDINNPKNDIYSDVTQTKSPIYNSNHNNTHQNKNHNNDHLLQPPTKIPNKNNNKNNINNESQVLNIDKQNMQEIYNQAFASYMSDGPLNRDNIKNNNEKEPMLPTNPSHDTDDEFDVSVSSIINTIDD